MNEQRLVRISPILFLLILLGSAFVISMGIFNEIKLAKIRSEGKIVIDSGKLEKKSGMKTHFLKVKYCMEDNKSAIQSFPVDEDDYTHAMKIGTILIAYVAGNPELKRVGKYLGYNRTPLYLGIVKFTFSLAGIIIIEYKYRRSKKVEFQTKFHSCL